MANNFDVIVLGGGPGGYIAASEAGKNGKRVLLIEGSELGGVCLNAGCIPTKTLLHSTKFYQHLRTQDVHGIPHTEGPFDWPSACKWKNEVIGAYRKGIASLLKSSKVTVVQGYGVLQSRSTVAIQDEMYTGDAIIIATGSDPAIPPIQGLRDNPYVYTSTELLNIDHIPEHLVVIGGGVIGLEFAAMFSQVGSQVTVLEMLPEIAPLLEPEIRKTLIRALGDISIEVEAKVTSVENNIVTYEKKGKQIERKADAILVATGRKPRTEGIGLKEAGVKTKNGFIIVNERMETSAPRVYAIGDVVGTSLFAHSASRMGEVAVRILNGKRSEQMNYHAIPWAIYTWPEVAGCGITEKQAKEQHIEVTTATGLMRLSARYFAENGSTPGMIKVVVRSEDRVLLGVQMIGGASSEMIWGATMAVELGLTVEQIVATIFPHPTVGEVLRDVLLQIS